MTALAEKILKEALGLSPVDRAELIQRLFQSFDDSDDRRTDFVWSEEVESRLDAYRKGEITAFPVEDVIERIKGVGR